MQYECLRHRHIECRFCNKTFVMNTKVPKAELSSSTSQNDIKPEPPSDDSDNEEEGIYKNLTEEQLLRARKYNECFICQKRCTSFSNFRSHVFQHANANKFKCEKCFNEFAQLKYLKAHLTTHNENRVFTCDMCKQNFASKSSIRGHMRVHTGEKPYKCSFCDRAFSESSTRRKHSLTHLPSEKKESYPCEICGKVIKTLSYFKEHMAIHTGAKNVECPICNKSFSRKSSLREHIATHTDRAKEHICTLCTRAFHHRTSLWKHKKRPCLPLKPTEPVYNCEMCATIFKGIIAQVQGDENRNCKLCGKSFQTTRGLNIHLRKHMADKKFLCMICSNKYTPDGNLKRSYFA